MRWRGITVAGSVLAACLEAGLGLRVIAQASGESERRLGALVRRGVRARLRPSAPDLPALLGPLLDLHEAVVEARAGQRAGGPRRPVEALGKVWAWGWDPGPLARALGRL